MKKFAVCSDIGLESRFRRMTTKKIEQYHEDLLISFNKLIDIIIEEKTNFFFIIGNLFGKVKPLNSSINVVLNGLIKLSENKVDTFIFPGNLETPLFTTKEMHAFEIYRNIPRIHILYDNNFQLNNFHQEIINASFKKKIQGIEFNFFFTPNPLIPLSKFEFNLDLSGDACEIFLIGDITAFKKEQDQKEIHNSIIKLDENPLTNIFIGGNFPDYLNISQMKNQVIKCPQINANNFDFAQINLIEDISLAKYKSGVKFMDYDPIDQSFSNIHLIPVSSLKIENIHINLNSLEPKLWDDQIKKCIQVNSNDNKFVRLQLEGTIAREMYHKFLSIYQFFDIGRGRNYHFEIDDLIVFEKAAEDISNLRIIDELEKYTNKRIEEFTQDEIEDDSQSSLEIIYRKAMEKIKIEYQRGHI